LNFYTSQTQEKYSCIHFSIHYDGIDANVKDWAFLKEKPILESIKSKPKTKSGKNVKIDHGKIFLKIGFGNKKI
jgi:hypothetical protein